MKTDYFDITLPYDIFLLKGVNKKDKYYLSQKKKRYFFSIKLTYYRIIDWQFFANDEGGWNIDLYFGSIKEAINFADEKISNSKKTYEKPVKI